MKHRALVFASYGSSRESGRSSDIAPVAAELAEAFPDVAFREAYTSAPVRKVLAHQGIASPAGLKEVLGNLADEGIAGVAVQPGLVVAGSSMEAAIDEVRGMASRFPEGIAVGRPLLSSQEDVEAVAAALDHAWPARPGHALVLVGHGSGISSANLPYLALRDVLHGRGRGDVVLGLLEGEPGIDAVAEGLARRGAKSATLIPLMLAAGIHAARQLAGVGPESWCSRLCAEGIEATCNLSGLGSYPEIRAVYRTHASAALEEILHKDAAATAIRK